MKTATALALAASASPPTREPASLATVAVLDRLQRLCAISVMLIGVIVLLGWALKIEALKSVLPGLASMKPNTAVAFVLAGVALGLRQQRGLRLGSAFSVMLLGFLSLAQNLSGANFGIDQLLFRDPPGAAQAAHPGRMAGVAAVNFMLLGGALALLGNCRAAQRRVLEALALLALTLAMLALIGYAYNAEALYALPGFGSMALHTALAFVLLAIGTLCARADGLAGVVASGGLGGLLARRFLPMAFFTPVLLGWLALQGEQAGLYDSQEKSALFALGMVLALMAFSLRNVVLLQAADVLRRRAVQALRENEQRLRALGDNLPDSFIYNYTHDADGRPRFLHVSAGVERLRGVRAEDVLRDAGVLLDQAPPEYAQRLAEAEARSARELSDIEMEFPIRRSDGQMRWLNLHSRPRRLADGQVVWDAMQTDISQKKRREGNLEFLADLQTMFGPLASSADILRVASRRIVEHLGLNRCLLVEIDEAAGQATVLHDAHARNAGAAPSLAGVYRLTDFRTDAERRRMAAGEAVTSDDVLLDADARSPLERQRLASRGIRALVSAPYVSDGRWKFMLSGSHSEPHAWPAEDVALLGELAARVCVRLERARAEEALQLEVAERKQAEDELRASNQRTQMATAATGVGIWEWNLAANTIRWDAQMFEIYGVEPTPDGLVPYSAWSGCVLPEDLPRQEALLQGTISRGGYSKRDFRIRRSNDAATRHIEAGETVRHNADGKPEWVVGTNLDITERSRLQQEALAQAQALLALDRRKDEFLAMLGHELRNPLAAIANAVQLQRMQTHEEPLQQQGRAIIERQVGQLSHLVDDLLDVSRITSGSVRLRQQSVSVSAIIERAVETAQPLIDQHRHALSVSLPQQPLYLYADAARLEQVLVNLLNNAAKYTDDGGQISLSVEQEADASALPMVVIRVRDNGVGIAPELLPHVFDLFTQAERSLDRSQGGLGIGLSLVQRLVELHGGKVSAHSVLGEGSEFAVRLPLLQAALPRPAPAPQTPLPWPRSASESLPPVSVPLRPGSARAGQPTPGCDVLVVDDNVDAADSLAALFALSGHSVRVAYDGPSAVTAATLHRPALALLDIGLPGLDGYQAAQRIRQQPELKGIVLVALTGYGQDTDRQRSQEAGFDHHLTKPVDFEELEKIVTAALHKAA